MFHIKEDRVKYDMSNLYRVQLPGAGNIQKTVAQIAAILGEYPCNHDETHGYGN